MLLELRMGNILKARVNQEKQLFLNIKNSTILNIKIVVLKSWFLPIFKLFKVCFVCVGR